MDFRQYSRKINEEVKKYYQEKYSRNAKYVSVNGVIDVHLVFDECSFTVRRKNVTIEIGDTIIQVLTNSTFKSIEYSIEIAKMHNYTFSVDLDKYEFPGQIAYNKTQFALRSKLDKQLCFRVNKKYINGELLAYMIDKLCTFLSRIARITIRERKV